MSQLMGEMFIEQSETKAEESPSDILVAENGAIVLTPSSVICMWC